MPKDKPPIIFGAAGDEHRRLRLRCAKACRAYNDMLEDATVEQRVERWCAIIGQSPDKLPSPPADSPSQWLVPYVKGPIFVDYGTNLHIGRTTFINRGCMILDTTASKVVIGDDCSIGPRVSIYSVTHPKDRRLQRGPLQIDSLASDVIIGDNCWIGGMATILPGVIVGEGAVIGACSVVTKDVPAYHVAYGTPAKVRGTVAADIPCEVPNRQASSELPRLEDIPSDLRAYVHERGLDGLRLRTSDILSHGAADDGGELEAHSAHGIPASTGDNASKYPMQAQPRRRFGLGEMTFRKDVFYLTICFVNFLLALAALLNSRLSG